MKLSEVDLKSFIIGMILGDSYTVKGKNAVNYNIGCKHSPKQLEYLVWKLNVLRENLQKNYWISEKHTTLKTSDGQSKVYTGYSGVLGTHNFITKIREEMYEGNKKKATPEILRQLTPIGLAVFYMDDGNLAYHKNKNGSIKSRNVTLHVQNFDLESQNNILKYLAETFGIEGRLHRDKKYFRIWFNVVNSIKFLAIVAPYIVPSMQYKIDLKYERKQIDLLHLSGEIIQSRDRDTFTVNR